MARKSAHAKRTDQLYCSQAEYEKGTGIRRVSRRALVKAHNEALSELSGFLPPQAIERIHRSAKREKISLLEKLSRYERKAKVRSKR